jgi:RHS repeat-associated protein
MILSSSGRVHYSGQSNYLINHLVWNSNGTVASTKDAAGNTTLISYNGTGGCNGLLPTSTTYPVVGGVQLSTSQTWDCNGGVVTSTTDANSNATNYHYNDPLWRLTSTNLPDGGSTTISYNTGSSFPWSVSTATAVDSTQNSTVVQVFDGLGRVVQKQATSDPGGTDYVNTTYNNLGQIYSVTNPFRTTSDPTYGLTYYYYDALGRTTSVSIPSGSSKTISYTGRATEVDIWPRQDHFTKIYQVDGLGRVVDTCEVTSATQADGSVPGNCGLDITGTGFLATTSYDALGNMQSLAYGSSTQTRTFSYDGLSRLLSASYPESGVTTYTYDTQEAGDLYQRTAPKPNQASGTVTATYTHDALHRLTGVSYNDGITSSVGYSYDQASVWNVSLGSSKGRLSSASVAGVTNRTFGYGAVGRVVVDGQCTPQNCGTTNFVANYGYNYIGEPLSESDVQGAITWTNTYNPMGQLTQVYTNWLSPTQTGDIVSGVAYNALGQPTSDLLGNSVQETWTYNNNTTLASYNASYNGSSLYSYTPTWFATELTGVSDSLNGNWSYSYDDFDRVHTANQTGGQSLSFAYDRWGNRWGQIANVTQYSYDQHNHITSGGITYDAAGNITYDGFHSYTYDAENRVLKVDNGSTATYTYDAFGGRNSSVVSGTSTEYLFDPQGRSITAIPAGTTHIRYGEVYAGNRHWVTDNGSALFIHPDMPGTGRVWTNLNGSVAQTCTSLPFGDNLTCNVGLSNVHFTGQIHDGESNLEHFPFRQYAGLEGRWLTPDPAGAAVMDVTSPQTWNRYAYVMNNPVSNIDPTGLVTINPNWYMGFAGGGNCTMDGADMPCNVVQATVNGGGAAQCPNNNCQGVTLNNFGEFYRNNYNANPDIFQYDDSGFYPTHWVSTFLGNAGDGLPSSVLCVYIGSNCDIPLNGAFFQGNRQLWRNASGAANAAFIATGAVVAGVPLAGELGTSAAGDFLFSRGTGLLNSNDFLRIGWGWYGGNIIDFLPVGGEVFRVVVGSPDGPIHWHLWPF